MKTSTLYFALAAITLMMASCDYFTNQSSDRYLAAYRNSPNHGSQSQTGLRDDVSFWAGDRVAGKPKIHINLELQKAYFYKDDNLVGVARISTGREGFDTPAGRYKISQKNRDHRSNLYGEIRDKTTGEVLNKDADIRKDPVPPDAEFVGASMPYFLRFNGGIGMHTGYLPGYNASHGCVRLPDHVARKFFEHSNIGTPVIVEK